MSQKTVYLCDSCQQEIGNKKHISLQFGGYSGISNPPNQANKQWTISPSVQGNFKHFCNPSHLAQYFKDLMKTGEAKNNHGNDRRR